MIYPVDSVIQPLNNWALDIIYLPQTQQHSNSCSRVLLPYYTPVKLRITVATSNTLLCWGLWTNLAQLESRDRQLTRRWQSAMTGQKKRHDMRLTLIQCTFRLTNHFRLFMLENSSRASLHLSSHLSFAWGWPLNKAFDLYIIKFINLAA